MNSSNPHFVQRYAWRQLELMESEGLSEEAARVRVDAEVAARGAADGASKEWLAPPPSSKRMMSHVQAEEDDVLRAAQLAGRIRMPSQA